MQVGTTGRFVAEGQDDLAAIVTGVTSDGRVHLTVFKTLGGGVMPAVGVNVGPTTENPQFIPSNGLEIDQVQPVSDVLEKEVIAEDSTEKGDASDKQGE